MKNMNEIQYPYLPEGREILYVPGDNPFIEEAREITKKYKGNLRHPHAVVIVRDGEIVSWGSIGENYHAENGCERIKHNMPTGQGYELCPGCHEDNHSEASALRRAKENNINVLGADVYFWGHWWCCKPCWDKMIEAGVKDVYLLENSEILFNPQKPGNIIGRQFSN